MDEFEELRAELDEIGVELVVKRYLDGFSGYNLVDLYAKHKETGLYLSKTGKFELEKRLHDIYNLTVNGYFRDEKTLNEGYRYVKQALLGKAPNLIADGKARVLLDTIKELEEDIDTDIDLYFKYRHSLNIIHDFAIWFLSEYSSLERKERKINE